MIEDAGGSHRSNDDEINSKPIKITSNSSSNANSTAYSNIEINESNEMEISEQANQFSLSNVTSNQPANSSSNQSVITSQPGNELEALLTSLLSAPPPGKLSIDLSI